MSTNLNFFISCVETMTLPKILLHSNEVFIMDVLGIFFHEDNVNGQKCPKKFMALYM